MKMCGVASRNCGPRARQGEDLPGAWAVTRGACSTTLFPLCKISLILCLVKHSQQMESIAVNDLVLPPIRGRQRHRGCFRAVATGVVGCRQISSKLPQIRELQTHGFLRSHETISRLLWQQQPFSIQLTICAEMKTAN